MEGQDHGYPGGGRVSALRWASGLLILPLLASAAPATYKKSGPDARGVVVHWVKCDNGYVSTVQCLNDTAHCGEQFDRYLAREAVLACDSFQGLIMEPVKK